MIIPEVGAGSLAGDVSIAGDVHRDTATIVVATSNLRLAAAEVGRVDKRGVARQVGIELGDVGIGGAARMPAWYAPAVVGKSVE